MSQSGDAADRSLLQPFGRRPACRTRLGSAAGQRAWHLVHRPGGATFTSSVRLAGTSSRAPRRPLTATAATLWSTAFGQPTGQVGAGDDRARPARVSSLDLAVVADGRHSVPTKLRLIVDGKATRQLTLSARRGRHPTANATTAVHVTFPAVTGRSFRLTIDGVRAEQTVDFFTRLPYDEPAAIAEVGLAGVRRRSRTDPSTPAAAATS